MHFEIGSLIGLGLISLAGMHGQPAPGMPLSLSPSLGLQTCATTADFLHERWG